jgi:hypothetical protein
MDFQLSASNVAHVVSLGTNNQASVFKESGELVRDLFAYYVYSLSSFFQMVYSQDIHPFRFVSALMPDSSIHMD